MKNYKISLFIICILISLFTTFSECKKELNSAVATKVKLKDDSYTVFNWETAIIMLSRILMTPPPSSRFKYNKSGAISVEHFKLLIFSFFDKC